MEVTTPERAARRISLGYALVGVVWILFSDAMLERLSARIASMAYFSIVKDLAFVLVTGAFLYFLLARRPGLADKTNVAEQPDAAKRHA